MESFKNQLMVPPYVGEQVMVLCPFGNSNMGYILRGIYENDSEPITHTEKDRETEYVEYKDGTKGEISLKDKHIKLETPNDIKIKVVNSKEIILEADKSVTVKAPQVTVDSPSIDLGVGGTGVVTQECICPIMGIPHIYGSINTRSVR